MLAALRENVKAMRAQLDPRSDWIRVSSAPENPMMLLVFKEEVLDSKDLSIEDQDQIFRDVVDEVCLVSPPVLTVPRTYPAKGAMLMCFI